MDQLKHNRSRLLLPITAKGYWGALLCISGIYAYVVFYLKTPTSPDLTIFIGLVLPLGAWSISRPVRVIYRIRIYNGRGKPTLS
jgi:hypothetical protein